MPQMYTATEIEVMRSDTRPYYAKPFSVDASNNEVHVVDANNNSLMVVYDNTQIPLEETKALKAEHEYWTNQGKIIAQALNQSYPST